MNRDQIHISKLTMADLEDLKSLSIETFSESFAGGNKAENMKKYMDIFFSDKKLAEELQNSNSTFYFARFDHSIIGYLKINVGSAQTELQDKNGLEIERIYVKSAFQGNQIGQLLFDKAIQIANTNQADFLWLAVWEKNPGAIRFYERNGLVKFSSHPFKLGNDVQTDIMMKIDLKK